MLRRTTLLLLVLAASAEAQPFAMRSALRGSVASIATTRPVATAEVRLLRVDSVKSSGEIYTDSAHSHLAITDSGGKFALKEVPSGNYLMTVRRVGYKPFEGMLTLGASPLEMELGLETSVAELPQMNVTELTSRATKRLDAVGFNTRRQHGAVMHAYDHTDLLATHAVRMEQILERYGITIADKIMFDGLPVDWNDLMLIPAEVIVGVEIYRSVALAPVEFTRTLPGRQTFTDIKPVTTPANEKVLVAKQPASAGVTFTPPQERDKGTPITSHFVLIWSYIP